MNNAPDTILGGGSGFGSGGGVGVGVTQLIRFAIGIGAAQNSVSIIPLNAIIVRAFLDIVTPYSIGATITLGTAANATLFMAAGDSNPQVAALYDALQDTSVAVAHTLLATVAGAPAVGAGFAAVEFAIPLI